MQTYSKKIKAEVKKMRINGLSLNEIYEKMHIPKTTIRGWISHIELTKEQKALFKKRTLESLQKGRIRLQKQQKEFRLQEEKALITEGIKEVGKVTKRELFLVGVALYWAEGFKNKYEHRLGFCNSDPKMVQAYILWLEKCLAIDRSNLVIRVTLNIAYKDKVKGIEKYWSDFLQVSLEQFTKPFYQHSLWKKEFSDDNYKGVVRIHVKDSLKLLFKMRGWIEALKMVK